MPDKQPMTQREVMRFFTKRYEYPGKFTQELHAIYDKDNDKHMIINYIYCKNEDQLKELTFQLDEIYNRDLNNYLAMQKEGLIDENGNMDLTKGNSRTKESSLIDKVKAMKKLGEKDL